MAAKRETENMDAKRTAAKDLDAIKAKAAKPDEMEGVVKRPRCPECGSPRYKVVSSPLGPIAYVKCDYCGHGFKVVK